MIIAHIQCYAVRPTILLRNVTTINPHSDRNVGKIFERKLYRYNAKLFNTLISLLLANSSLHSNKLLNCKS